MLENPLAPTRIKVIRVKGQRADVSAFMFDPSSDTCLVIALFCFVKHGLVNIYTEDLTSLTDEQSKLECIGCRTTANIKDFVSLLYLHKRITTLFEMIDELPHDLEIFGVDISSRLIHLISQL